MATRVNCENTECNHPLTFHGGRALKLSTHSYQTRNQVRCRALGCHCSCFEGTDPGLPEWTYKGIGPAEVAEANGLAVATVRKNAPDYGGVKVDGAWLFPSTVLATS